MESENEEYPKTLTVSKVSALFDALAKDDDDYEKYRNMILNRATIPTQSYTIGADTIGTDTYKRNADAAVTVLGREQDDGIPELSADIDISLELIGIYIRLYSRRPELIKQFTTISSGLQTKHSRICKSLFLETPLINKVGDSNIVIYSTLMKLYNLILIAKKKSTTDLIELHFQLLAGLLDFYTTYSNPLKWHAMVYLNELYKEYRDGKNG